MGQPTRNGCPIKSMKVHKLGKDWIGETAFIVAGGTSVENQDISRLQGHRVIAVNSSYQVAPFADYLVFADQRWWEDHREALKDFRGKILALSGRSHSKNVFRMGRIKPPPGISNDPSKLVVQRTTTQAAINALVHKGVKRIALVGVDQRRSDDGRTHHHGPHKWKNKEGNKTWDAQMQQLRLTIEPLRQLGIEVVNLSPISRIEWWPKVDFNEFLDSKERW